MILRFEEIFSALTNKILWNINFGININFNFISLNSEPQHSKWALFNIKKSGNNPINKFIYLGRKDRGGEWVRLGEGGSTVWGPLSKYVIKKWGRQFTVPYFSVRFSRLLCFDWTPAILVCNGERNLGRVSKLLIFLFLIESQMVLHSS